MAKPVFKEMLIATLGRSSQVGTRTFDELFFNRQIPLSEVVWIHSREGTPDMQRAIGRVRHEVDNYYKEKDLRVNFHFVTIKGRLGNCPMDTRTREDAEAVLYTLHEQLSHWKALNYTVHLSISGGAKVLSAFGVAAAQLTFDSERDKCWHLVAQDKVTSREEMHAVPGVTGDEVCLIDVPVLSWKTWKEFSSRSLAEAIAQDPLQAQNIVAQLGASELFGWRYEFVERVLDEGERQILERLSLLGWENEEIDHALGCSCKNTLARIWRRYCDFIHNKAAASYCSHDEELHALDSGRLRRGRLVADFHLVFQQREAKKPQAERIGCLR